MAVHILVVEDGKLARFVELELSYEGYSQRHARRFSRVKQREVT